MWLKILNTWSSMSLIIIINTYNNNTNKQQNLIVLIYVWLNEVGRSTILVIWALNKKLATLRRVYQKSIV